MKHVFHPCDNCATTMVWDKCPTCKGAGFLFTKNTDPNAKGWDGVTPLETVNVRSCPTCEERDHPHLGGQLRCPKCNSTACGLTALLGE